MFFNIISSKVKKELKNNNFGVDGELSVISVNDGVYTLLLNADKEYIVKYYENSKKSCVGNYKIIDRLKVKSVEYFVKGSRLLVYENLVDAGLCRCVKLKDLKDENDIRALARWCKDLHALDDVNCVDFYKDVNASNVLKLMKLFRLNDNKSLVYIYNYFENIYLKFSRISKCLVCGFFNSDSVIFYKDNVVHGFDYDGLVRGNRYDDIEKIVDSLDEEGKKIFLMEYGEIDEIEVLMSRVLGPIVVLIKAMNEKNFPYWAHKALEIVNKKEFYDEVKSLVEWH